nr:MULTISPECIES: FecR domain-containing protein [unclassified Bradyrhizobium]
MVFRLAFATWLVAAVLIDAPAGAAPSLPPAASATAPDGTQIAQAQPAQQPVTPPSADSAAAPAISEPIGNVAALTGTVTVIRNKDSRPLKLRDDIFLNDVVQTSAASSLGITFDDGTTFHLSANAKIAIDNYVYEDGGKQNSAVFNIGRGTVAFVAAAVAKTGDMKIDTPTATLGIRGTTGVVDVPETISAASGAANNVAIKLYPDADGRVGHIEVNDRNGARLGALTTAASGFSIRPGAAGVRFAAVPLMIAAREIQRDQGIVRQVHTTQSVGRQIVTEQRAFRRANPGIAPNRNAPQAPQAPQRQTPTPGQNNNRPGGQPPVAPNSRQGQPQQKQLPQPGRSPDRRGGRLDHPQGGQHQQPAQPQPPALPGRQGQRQPQQPNPNDVARPAATTLPPPPAQVRPGAAQRLAPRLQRPALPPRPAQQRRRPAPKDGRQLEPR